MEDYRGKAKSLEPFVLVAIRTYNNIRTGALKKNLRREINSSPNRKPLGGVLFGRKSISSYDILGPFYRVRVPLPIIIVFLSAVGYHSPFPRERGVWLLGVLVGVLCQLPGCGAQT